jgi:hypothetical protein
LRRLAHAFEGLDVHYVSTNPGVLSEVAPAPLAVVPDANLKDKFALLQLAFRMFWLVLSLRPDIVVSTGAPEFDS